MTTAPPPSVPRAPLAGIRVVELAVYAQGPIAGALLAFLGAEVIKLEPATGDPTRQTLTASVSNDPVGPPDGFLWRLCNANKESAVVDMRDPDHRTLFEDLIRSADAFVSNLMDESLRGYRTDRETLLAINPELVYGRTGGFGYEGPLANDPCQDTVGMAYAGMLDRCAIVEGVPNYPQYAISDVLSGTMLAFGVVTALLARERLGYPAAVSTSQLQTMMWAQLANISAVASYGPSAIFPLHDQRKPRSPLMNMYEASDGKWIAMGLIRPHQWEQLISILDLPEMVIDPRFETLADRAKHSEELTALIAAAMKKRPSSEWLDEMRASKLYVAKVNTIEELVNDEQVLANNLIVELDDGWKTVAMPFTVEGYQVPRTPPPQLGSWSASTDAATG